MIKHLLKPLQNNRGIALLIAMFSMMLMLFIAVEVSYDANVEYVVASQQVNKLRAYYAAKAGMELSLLRINLYKQAVIGLGDKLGPAKSMLDMIWSFPLMWPIVLPDGVSRVEQDQLKKIQKEALMEASYQTMISPESGKIDLNDLGSPVKGIRDFTTRELLKVFDTEVRNNQDFATKYGGTKFEEVINNIGDWVDEDSESRNGGDEKSYYRNYSEDEIHFLPPNMSFKTIQELHMVAGMKDDFYNLLAPRVTLYGVKGLNVNFAPKELLESLDTSMTKEVVEAILKRRTSPKDGGPFSSADDFLAYVQQFGGNRRAIEDLKIPLLVDPEMNFRISSIGLSGKSKHEIIAVTYDFDTIAQRYSDMFNKENPAPGVNNTQQQQAQQQQQQQASKPATPAVESSGLKMKASKGRPRIVFWEEN